MAITNTHELYLHCIPEYSTVVFIHGILDRSQQGPGADRMMATYKKELSAELKRQLEQEALLQLKEWWIKGRFTEEIFDDYASTAIQLTQTLTASSILSPSHLPYNITDSGVPTCLIPWSLDFCYRFLRS